MRSVLLRGRCVAWEAGPRSAAELREAATHYERAAALSSAPAVKAQFAGNAAQCGRRGCGGRRGGCSLCGLALLRLQRRQRLAHLLVARRKVWLLLPQLALAWGRARDASQVQPADCLQEAVVGHATRYRRRQHSKGVGRAQTDRQTDSTGGAQGSKEETTGEHSGKEKEHTLVGRVVALSKASLRSKQRLISSGA